METNKPFWSLRTKTILLLLSILFLMLSGTIGILSWYMMDRFASLEQTLLQDHIVRIRNTINEKNDLLDKISFDWGVWYDTYAFIRNDDAQYQEANLVIDVFTNLDIDAMVFIDDQGHFVYAMAQNDQGALEPISDDLKSFIESGPLMTNKDPSVRLRGLVLLPEGPMMISSSPILPSDGLGDVRGNLLVTYRIDEAYVQELRDQLQLDLSLDLVSDPASAQDFATKVLSMDSIQAMGHLDDLTGHPILNLSVITDRDVYQTGKESVSLVGSFIMLLSALCVIILSLFMNRNFLKKLRYITESVDRIGIDKDFTRRLSPFKDHDEFNVVVGEINGMLDDLETVQKDNEYKAHHDALTGLPNRRLLSTMMAHAFSKAQRNNTKASVYFMDLDDFKTINDTQGHDAGDAILIQVADRLSKTLRQSDILARIGGDEFIVLAEDLNDPAVLTVIADKILAAFMAPFDSQGTQITLSVSIGIAVFPFDGNDPETLIKQADQAMYQAKALGKSRYAFFSKP